MVSAKKHWQVEDAKTTRKQHRPGHGLDGELHVRADRMNVVINAEREDKTTRQQNGEQSSERESEAHCDVMPTGRQRDCEGQKERKKNRDAAESGKRTAV